MLAEAVVVVEHIRDTVGIDQYVIPGRRPSNPALNTRWREYPDKPASPQAIGRIVEEVAIRAALHCAHPSTSAEACLWRPRGEVRRSARRSSAPRSRERRHDGIEYVDKPGLDELAVSVQGFR